MEPQRCWNMNAAAELSGLAEVRRFTDEVARAVDLDSERTFDLKVAVSEACANAMEHAGATASIEVCVEEQTDRLVVEVADRGTFSGPDPIRAETRDHRGLGLPLMIALMDEVSVKRMAGRGTVVTLTLYLNER